MKKILTIIGARPQFIKAASFSYTLKNNFSDIFNEIIIHTGQHYDNNMSKIFFEEMKIPKPKYMLDIGSGSHAFQTGNMLIEIEKICLIEKPYFLLVYGDTNSTLAGALAASKLNIPVIHIEAGLRSFNKIMPEEKNRILTDHISEFLFCPTKEAVSNLYNENVKKNVFLTGDIMYDSFKLFSNISLKRSNIKYKDFILLTIHRAENTDIKERLSKIIDIINSIDKKIIFPVHPRTKKILSEYILNKNITLIDPVGYLDMLNLLNHCDYVMTDSGGLQKEAAFANKLCITLRDETEWNDTVKEGWNVVSGLDKNIIFNFLKEKKKTDFSNLKNLFGNGNTSNNILNILTNF